MSGCPCKLLSMFLNVFSSSLSIYPFSASTAYRAADAWPFDKTNLSLSGESGIFASIFISLKYNTVKISAIENAPPICPDFAL